MSKKCVCVCVHFFNLRAREGHGTQRVVVVVVLVVETKFDLTKWMLGGVGEHVSAIFRPLSLSDMASTPGRCHPSPTNHQRWNMQNGSSVGICARCIHILARLAPIWLHSR